MPAKAGARTNERTNERVRTNRFLSALFLNFFFLSIFKKGGGGADRWRRGNGELDFEESSFIYPTRIILNPDCVLFGFDTERAGKDGADG